MTISRIPDFRSTASLARFCRRRDVRSHFFDSATVNYFASRNESSFVMRTEMTYNSWSGLFITSEQDTHSGIVEPRMFTVRTATIELRDGGCVADVDTVGEFQEHATYAAALAAMQDAYLAATR